MRFAAAAAGLKCTRLGGSAGAPYRAEVETLLASPYPAAASNP
jgi:sugar/nucleoside kinase (ribokinase family)